MLSSKYHCDHPSYFGDLRALKCQSVSQSSDDSGIRDCLGTMTSLEVRSISSEKFPRWLGNSTWITWLAVLHFLQLLQSETFEDHVLTDVRSHAKASQPSTPRTQDGVEQSMTFSTPGDDYFTNSDAESLKPRHKSGVLPKGYSTSRIPRYTGFGGKLTNDPQNHQPETVTSKVWCNS